MPITAAAITFRIPLIASGFQGMILISTPPVEKRKEAISMQTMPMRLVLFFIDFGLSFVRITELL
jgi:hypothetical protein